MTRRQTPFGAELKRAMTGRGVTVKALSDATGIACTSLSGYRHGRRPSHRTAIRLAEVLMWPTLVELVVQTATKRCIVCEREFIDGGQQQKAFCCSKSCYRTNRSRLMRGESEARRLHHVRRLAVFQESVLAFCRGCEPEGLCRDSGCVLRPVSPLPLADARLRVA